MSQTLICYLGAQEKEQRFGAPLAVSVVVNLCKYIKRKGYNITCYNFSTSLPVAEKLARDKLSIVGTMQKNRRELCKKMTESENKATYSSNFYWHDSTNFLFVKYQAKEKKSVCLLSSMHDSTDVDTSNEKKKPEMILFYKRVTSNRITRWQFILMLVENLLGKPEACVSNSNRQLRGDDEGVRKRKKCHDACCDNKKVSTCILCQKPTCGKCSKDNFIVTYVKCLACVKRIS